MMKKNFFAAFAASMSLCAMAGNEPFLTKVYDFMPAPGQFVNSLPQAKAGDTKADVLARVAEAICGSVKKRC